MFRSNAVELNVLKTMLVHWGLGLRIGRIPRPPPLFGASVIQTFIALFRIQILKPPTSDLLSEQILFGYRDPSVFVFTFFFLFYEVITDGVYLIILLLSRPQCIRIHRSR